MLSSTPGMLRLVGKVARVEHDAGERLLADRGDQLRREQRQLFGDQEGISAAAHVEHPLVVEIEAGLEAVVRAQDLHRQPGGHDLGDGGRDERLVGVLGHQLVALGVHHQHQPRRSQRRDLLLGAGQDLAGQEEEGKEQQASTASHLRRVQTRGIFLTCSGPNPKKSRPA